MLRRSLDCGSGEAPAGAWVQLVPSSVEARSADSPVKKGTVLAVRHDHIGNFCAAYKIFTIVIEGQDMRVIKSCDSSNFALKEAGGIMSCISGGVWSGFGAQDFDGYDAIHTQILATINSGHATPADGFL